jgi:hypothetical protein
VGCPLPPGRVGDPHGPSWNDPWCASTGSPRARFLPLHWASGTSPVAETAGDRNGIDLFARLDEILVSAPSTSVQTQDPVRRWTAVSRPGCGCRVRRPGRQAQGAIPGRSVRQRWRERLIICHAGLFSPLTPRSSATPRSQVEGVASDCLRLPFRRGNSPLALPPPRSRPARRAGSRRACRPSPGSRSARPGRPVEGGALDRPAEDGVVEALLGPSRRSRRAL